MAQFRDRREDRGQAATLYGGLNLKERGELAGVDYGSVSMAQQQLAKRRQEDLQLVRRPRQAEACDHNKEPSGAIGGGPRPHSAWRGSPIGNQEAALSV